MTTLRERNLIVVLGPTGVGKTDLSIALARRLGAPIVSCDSRQFYRGMTIGTAAPGPDELRAVPHYLIQTKDPDEAYNCGMFEREASELLEELFRTHRNTLLVGGSGLYIDALCNGIDPLPDIDPALRERLRKRYETEGLNPLLDELRTLDPAYYGKVDRNNPSRVIRALEVCLQSGQPYSALRKGEPKQRNYHVVKIGLNRPREELYDRIDRRVEAMMEAGLVEEVRALLPYRRCNALQSVGYKEIFDYLDGTVSLEEAKELIARNSRRYAKRQLTWFNRDRSVRWFHPDDTDGVLRYLDE